MHIHDELSSRVQAIEGLLQERERGKHEGPVASYVGRSAVGGWTRDYLPSTSKGGYVGRWEGVMVAVVHETNKPPPKIQRTRNRAV